MHPLTITLSIFKVPDLTYPNDFFRDKHCIVSCKFFILFFQMKNCHLSNQLRQVFKFLTLTVN